MNLSNKRCGECGAKAYALKNRSGHWRHPWKDFPGVFITEELFLWSCGECGGHAVTGGDAKKIDIAAETSIRNQASQFLDVIKSKSGLSFEEIAKRVGVAPSYLSSLRSRRRTPSFHLWNLLKVMAIDPKQMVERLDPDYDIEAHNILLRA